MEARIRKLQQDLDTERRMRLEVEDVMKDIRREYKAPFIIPGFLKAGMTDSSKHQPFFFSPLCLSNNV
jgi:type II secretory pathway component PulM